MKRTLLVIATLGLAACRYSLEVPDGSNVACTTVFVPGVSVTFTDSVSGATGGLLNAWAAAHEGTYTDSVLATGLPTQLIANLTGERVGTYVVTAGATGYKTQTNAGVSVVKLDACHVKTVLINARLIRVQ